VALDADGGIGKADAHDISVLRSDRALTD